MGRAATRALQGLVLLAATVVVVYGSIQLKLVVIPLMISLILAAALNPVVEFLRRRGVPGALAACITFLATIALLGGGHRRGLRRAQRMGRTGRLRGGWARTVAGVHGLRPGPVPVGQEALDDAVGAVRDYVTGPGFGAGALLGISASTQVITGAVLVPVILYSFLQDGARMRAFFLHRFHGEALENLLASGVTTLHVLGGCVRGTAVVALLEAVVIGVTLVVLRVPLALPLAVLIFLGGFVPIVGAALIGAVAALVDLVANGPVVALVVVAVVVAINQLDGRVLQPMVLGRALSLHPLVVLLALAGGGILPGIVGAVLAVPLTAVGWALIRIWFPPPAGPAPLPGPARPAPSATSALDQLNGP